MDDGAALLKRVPVKGSQVRILFLPPINWRRIIFIALIWTFILNEGFCERLLTPTRLCNPFIISSCED